MKKKSSAGISGIIKSAVTDTAQASASFQSASGITARVIRTAHAGCCETCAALAGEYVYGKQPADFFRRHNGCSCTVAYDPGNGRYENVHKSQAWNESREAVEWRKQYALEIEKVAPAERSLKAEWQLSAKKKNNGESTIREVLGEVSEDRRQDAIAFFNNDIRDLEDEHAIIIQKDGTVIHFIGQADGVGIYDADLEGADVLHNHPMSNGVVSFGEDDFAFLKANQNIGSFWCCNKDFDYSITVLKSLDDISYSEVYHEALKKVLEEGINDIDIQDLAMQLLSDRGYIRYEKNSVNGRV